LSTIVFSTHDIELAVELADKIYVLGYPSENKHVGTIVGSFDLKALGLAWEPYSKDHIDLVKDIKKKILDS
jgi:polar amino acid transport system ATP-binding protein